MAGLRVGKYCIAVLCLAAILAEAEKQIKLEDIEKDTLKAAQQAKIEKQVQEQNRALHTVAYQSPTSFFQYVVPQQYIPQTHSQYIPVSDYAALAAKNLGVGYASPPHHQPYQTYLSAPTTSSTSHFPGYHVGRQIETVPQPQPIIMPFVSSLAAYQHHEQYYPGGIQYYPAQNERGHPFYFTPQTVDQGSTYQYSASDGAFNAGPASSSRQQYLTSYHSKGVPAFAQFLSAGSLNPATSPYAGQETAFSSVFSPATVHSNTETPIFVTVKAPKHLVASSGQKQQFAQTQTTTLSPLQTKYLNSPQYLAQNYNTIQSSQAYSKGSLSSGVKSTVSPPLKGSPLTGSNSIISSTSISGGANAGAAYLSTSLGSPVSSYLSFKSPPAKSYFL